MIPVRFHRRAAGACLLIISPAMTGLLFLFPKNMIKCILTRVVTIPGKTPYQQIKDRNLSTHSEACILALDLGTSGAKVALVTSRGKILGWEYQEVPLHILEDGGAEQDPEDWWRSFLKASARLMDRGLVRPDDIVAVCCATQGEGTVAVDKNGKPLMNAILWMDMRGAGHLRQITGGGFKVAGYNAFKLFRWIRLTGGAPSTTGKDPAAHMLFIKHERPEVYEKTYKFLNVLDYMNLRLTGRFAATPDSILTSWVTDNRNPDKIEYSQALIKSCGIEADKFPEIIGCTEVAGRLSPEAAQGLGLSQKVKVVAGSIDTTASAVGSGAVEDYEAHLYIGTSSWVAAHVPFKKTDVASALASVPCAVPGKYLLTALQATAGGNLTFLKEKILYHQDELLRDEALPDVYKIMDRIAARVPAGSNGVIYTPWIYGERAPVDDRFVRAGLYNLSLENSREDIIRAFLEGVALNTKWLMGPVEKFLKRKMERISLVGGGANSNVWCRILADVLNLTVRQVKDPIQANARGAAFMAAVGLKMISFNDIPELMEYQGEYRPDPENVAVYGRLFKVFVDIYRKNKGIYQKLNS